MSPQDRCDADHLGAENQRLQALLELSGQLADSALNLREKLQRCVDVMARLCQAERCSLALVEGDQLVVKASTNPQVVDMATPLAAPSISTDALRQGSPVYTKDISHSVLAEFGREGDQSQYRTGSLISLPLMDHDQGVGVFNLADKIGQPYFNDQDFAAAQHIAAQVTRLVAFSALHSRLEDAYRELRRTSQEKNDLMYLVFHDMKAPVTAVKEVLKLLSPEAGLSEPERQQYLALAQGDLELLWRRITNLLDLNRMDGHQLPVRSEPLDLAQVAQEVIMSLSAVSRVREVTVELAPGPGPMVMADEDLVERVLVNLLFNALKFSSPEEGGGGRVLVNLSSAGGKGLVEIADTGGGVTDDLGQGIFERFSQGKITQGSTGLGLYFCRRAAWLLGGEVDYRNEPQGGAVFYFTLPLVAAVTP